MRLLSWPNAATVHCEIPFQILDQVASWQHDLIDMKLLTDALGILARSEYRAILNLIREKNAAAIISKIGEVLESGIGATEFVRGFQEELRLLLVFRVAPEIAPTTESQLKRELSIKRLPRATL